MIYLREVSNLDAIAQARLIRSGEVSALELTEAALTEVERLNPVINAVIHRMDDQALKTAHNLNGEKPFAGVPFLLKDLLAECAGEPMTEGSRFLAGRYVSKVTSTYVDRLKSAGLIIIGKTNTPEFGLLPTTEPELNGATHNPWDLKRSPGGSSGGSASAVAARIVPMAHANDGGGSIRIPASCCGLFGLKPTRGRNPLGPMYGDVGSGMVVEHAITRSVRDSAALLDMTAGHARGDPYRAPMKTVSFFNEVNNDPGCLRIAVSAKPSNGVSLNPDCREAFDSAVTLCEDLGHEISEDEPSFEITEFLKSFGLIWTAFANWNIKRWAKQCCLTPSVNMFEPNSWSMYENGEKRTAGDYLLAVEKLQLISRKIAEFFIDYDVWLTPTQAVPPVRLGYFKWSESNRDDFIKHISEFSGFTSIANATGQPAMSVPLHWTDSGLPVGIQFMARFGDEVTLFRLAGQLEKAKPWLDRRPMVST